MAILVVATALLLPGVGDVGTLALLLAWVTIIWWGRSLWKDIWKYVREKQGEPA